MLSRVWCSVSGKSPHHNGEGFALSEKGVVRSRIATMLDRHPPVGKVAAHLTASA